MEFKENEPAPETPPPQANKEDIPQSTATGKKRKDFVYTEARKVSFEKCRVARQEKIKAKKESAKALPLPTDSVPAVVIERKSVDPASDKEDESEESEASEEEDRKHSKKTKKSRKNKKKKVESESESSESDGDQVAGRRFTQSTPAAPPVARRKSLVFL
jgi:hypothetical protein